MKKHIKSAILLAFTLCVVVVIGAANAYAGLVSLTGTGTLGSSSSTLSVTTSNKVAICYNGASQSFAAGSDHIAGSKIFGTGSKVGIFFKTKTADGAYHCGGETTALVATGFVSDGWTAQ